VDVHRHAVIVGTACRTITGAAFGSADGRHRKTGPAAIRSIAPRQAEGDLPRKASTVSRMNQADVDARIQDYYTEHFAEAERLTVRSAQGRLEFERVQELIACRRNPTAVCHQVVC
jgi:hypothetical protein